MSNSVSTEKRSGIDTFLVGVTLFLTLLAIIWAAVSPDQFADIMKGAKNSIRPSFRMVLHFECFPIHSHSVFFGLRQIQKSQAGKG